MKKKFTVLLADDDKVQTLALSAQLRAWGFSVATAFDATYTIMVAMKNPIDVIVLDIQMPGGTGRSVLQRLKASTRTSQIPVIVLSGSTDPGVADEVKALGADEFLSKPAVKEQLYAALARVLGIPPEEQVTP